MNNSHYRVQISCYNDEGSVDNHNELHVFPRNPSHQPKIKRVLNSAQFELSWHAPTHQQDLTSYTVMYCNYISANVCQDSIRFAVVPPNTTKLRISSTQTLNFAVSANFAHFSTPLSWQECIVSPADVGIGQPKFDVIDVRGDSLVLLFHNGCIERSFYDRMRLLVWKGSDVVFRADFEPYRDRFAVQGLSPGTEYAVQVLAYDGLGMVQHTRTVVTKDGNENLLKAIFYISCGMLMALTIFTTAARRRVETPVQLTLSKQFPNETSLQPHSKEDIEDNNSVLVQLTSKTKLNDLDT
uniref:Cytokine receptor n=1 Tax=Culex pipiens TaxID=7175 RepID=A0A8D8PD86_CULPI